MKNIVLSLIAILAAGLTSCTSNPQRLTAEIVAARLAMPLLRPQQRPQPQQQVIFVQQQAPPVQCAPEYIQIGNGQVPTCIGGGTVYSVPQQRYIPACPQQRIQYVKVVRRPRYVQPRVIVRQPCQQPQPPMVCGVPQYIQAR